MKRNLMLLNLALLVVVCLLGWYLRRKWIESRDHERQVLSVAVRPVPVTPLSPLKKVAPIDAPAYATVVDRNLFSADRNPTPIPDPPKPEPPPPPMPPLPVAHGVMLWEGVPPTVVLSERGKAEQKGYHPGDRIGQFAVVSVNNKEVVFEWNGKEVAARLDDMMEKGLMNPPPGPGTPPQAPTPGQPPSVPAGGPAPNVVNLGNSGATANENGGSPIGPGPALPGQAIHSCVAGDNTPSGAVVNGLQKRVNVTPFNTVCLWEPVK